MVPMRHCVDAEAPSLNMVIMTGQCRHFVLYSGQTAVHETT